MMGIKLKADLRQVFGNLRIACFDRAMELLVKTKGMKEPGKVVVGENTNNGRTAELA